MKIKTKENLHSKTSERFYCDKESDDIQVHVADVYL